MTDYSRLDVGWLRARAEQCLYTAQWCDERANNFWSWFPHFGYRCWLRRHAVWWRTQQECWNLLADELQAKAQND